MLMLQFHIYQIENKWKVGPSKSTAVSTVFLRFPYIIAAVFSHIDISADLSSALLTDR